MTVKMAYLVFLSVSFASFGFIFRKTSRKKRFQEFAAGQVGQDQGAGRPKPLFVASAHALVFIFGAALGLPFAGAIVASTAVPIAILIGFRLGEQRSKRKMRGQVEGVLNELSCALYGNPSLSTAVREVACRSEDPIRTHLMHADSEISHGLGIDESMRSAARRVDDEIFSFAVDAVSICRATGANICTVLDRLAKLARD